MLLMEAVGLMLRTSVLENVDLQMCRGSLGVLDGRIVIYVEELCLVVLCAVVIVVVVLVVGAVLR